MANSVLTAPVPTLDTKKARRARHSQLLAEQIGSIPLWVDDLLEFLSPNNTLPRANLSQDDSQLFTFRRKHGSYSAACRRYPKSRIHDCKADPPHRPGIQTDSLRSLSRYLVTRLCLCFLGSDEQLRYLPIRMLFHHKQSSHTKLQQIWTRDCCLAIAQKVGPARCLTSGSLQSTLQISVVLAHLVERPSSLRSTG